MKPETIEEVKADAREWLRDYVHMPNTPPNARTCKEERVLGFIRRAFKAGFLADEQDRADARERGRKEGIAAVIAVCRTGTPAMVAWLESPEGRAAVDAELRKNGGER